MFISFIAAAGGSTPRVRIIQLDAMGNIDAWQGTMMANVPALTDAMLATGEIVMEEVQSDDGTNTGCYKGTWPAALTTPGNYTLQLRFGGAHSTSREVYSTGTSIEQAATVSEITAAVWDALTSSLDTVGSVGKKIADATFGSGDATLAKQNEILARVNVARVVYQGPIASDLTATIIQGDDYLDADGEALSWTIADYTGPSVSGATAALRIMQLADFNDTDTAAELSVTATAAMVGDDLVLKADLTAAQTAALSASPPSDKWNYIYQVVVTLSNGHTVTPARATGAMTVSKRIV